MLRLSSLLTILLFVLPAAAQGKSAADRAWEAIVALDEGPSAQPTTRGEALQTALGHLNRQRGLLDAFVREHPNDARVFEARMRIASITATMGALQEDNKLIDQALRMYATLERTRGITREQAADAAFRRASLFFHSAHGREERLRDQIVSMAVNFHTRYPGDERGPRLLIEAATICDNAPRVKRELLETVLRDSRDKALRERATDDIRRLERLGTRFNLSFPTMDGNRFTLADHRGEVVMLVFWSTDSPHSLFWMREFVESAGALAPGSCKIVTVSLDEERESLEEMIAELGIQWPTHFDGRGWEGPVARQMGINAVPTVWVFDKQGRLRSLNARNDYTRLIPRLARERAGDF